MIHLTQNNWHFASGELNYLKGSYMPKTKLMGILNATSDSFYPESRSLKIEEGIRKAMQIQEEGADILDIGGESSRPGSHPVEESEEFSRVIPLILALQGKLKIPISIDTRKPNIAKAAIEAGASLINDITGFSHPDMIQVAKETHRDICVMHMLGDPQTMQKNPKYLEGIVPYLLHWFKKKIEFLCNEGIKPEQIILDPGIGFGKTIADNLDIIHNLSLFKKLGFRLLLGVSRKSFLSKILNQQTQELLAPTLAANVIAMLNHVDIIRVHDIKEHRSVIDFIDVYLTNTKKSHR